MSVEYVIDNHKTEQFLYCTRAFGSIEPEHLVGDQETIEHNLMKHLHLSEPYKTKYCKWAAVVISTFIGDTSIEQIDTHPDHYFCGDYKACDIPMYINEDELDEWLLNK